MLIQFSVDFVFHLSELQWISIFFRLKLNLATLPYVVKNGPLKKHIVMKYCLLESKYDMK